MILRELLRQMAKSVTARAWGAGNNPQMALRQFERAELEASLGRLGAAEVHLRNAILFDRDSRDLHYNLGLLLHGVGDVAGAEACYMNALEIDGDFQAAHSSYLSLCDFSTEISKQEGLLRHRSWAQRFADIPIEEIEPHRNSRDPLRKLRIGYISADFRDHVIGRFIGPILENHESAQVEVHCYSASDASDAVTGRLSELVQGWHNVHALTDVELANRIRKDEIDILVDLSGHSAGNRLLALALKPAPVQLTWMGYLNTSGLAAIDYKCTDFVADPIGVEQYYRENLLRLEIPQWCYSTKFCAAGIRDFRNEVWQRDGESPIRLACMTRFMKISDLCLRTWVELLGRSPKFQLEIIDSPDHPRRELMRRQFVEAGVGNQVKFSPTLRPSDYWAKFKEIDIVLDPFPYTGATTTIDSLLMGVPVITLAGICGAGRSAASILSGAGLREFVTQSREEYVEAVCSLALALDAGRWRKSDVRGQFISGKSASARLFVAEWEFQLRQAWRQWCVSEIICTVRSQSGA